VTKQPPKLRLVETTGFERFSNSGHRIGYLGAGWSTGGGGSGVPLTPGLRGTGQYLSFVQDLSYSTVGNSKGGNWDSGGVCFDYRGGAGRIFVEVYTGGPNPIQVRSDILTGQYIVRNTNVSPTVDWVASASYPVSSPPVVKIEFLFYLKGGTSGFFQLWVEGVLVLERYGVNLGNNSNVAGNLAGFRWHEQGDIDNVFISVGVGGFTDGDVLSDTAGNPQLFALSPGSQGNYRDGTSTPAGGAANNWDKVDETVLNESNTTDFVALSTTTTVKESYIPLALPGTVTKVISVAPYFSHATDTGGQPQPFTFLRFNPQTGVAIDVTYVEPMLTSYASTTTLANGQCFHGIFRKNGISGRAFTVADVNTMEFGWGPSTGAAGLSRVGCAWLEVGCYDSPPAEPSITSPARAQLTQKTHRFSNLWKIEPVWGCPLFFTDHDRPLVVGGVTYVPTGAWSRTNERRELGLKESDQDFSGVINSTAITTNDLRAGRYRQARVTQMLVDWRYPTIDMRGQASAITIRYFTIEDTRFDGEKWVATMSGLLARMQNKVGDVYAPRCRARLFDRDYPLPGTTPDVERLCKLDSMSYYRTFDVTGAITDRRIFAITVNGSPSLPSGWFNDGLLVFVAGANTGVVGEIRDFSLGVVTLHLPLPFDVSSLENGMVWPGCNLLAGYGTAVGDCVDKFNNGVNYAGFDTQPGTDEAMRGGEL